MRILANICGAYLEPYGRVGVRDAVSCLQLQAVNVEETQILQQIHKILREGGTVSANPQGPGVIQINCEFDEAPADEPQNSPAVQGIEIAATTEPVQPPDQTTETVHEHVYSNEANGIHDPAGVWLGCECGEWNYFPRLVDPNDPDVEQAKPSLVH